MALKTLELRARRDAFVVFFLGFFIILTHFLYSQSLPVARRDAGLGLGPADRRSSSPTCRSASRACRQAAGLAARTALARRAGDGADVPALPAHRPALGRAAGRHLEDGPLEHHEDGLDDRGRARRLDRHADPLRRRGADAGRDVLPRPGADPLRRQRVDAARPALRAGEPAVAAADADDERRADRLRGDARAAAPRLGAAARGDDRGRRRSKATGWSPATTCSGSPTSRCSSGFASRRPRARASSSARRAASASCRTASSCRPASIRAPSPGRAPSAPSAAPRRDGDPAGAGRAAAHPHAGYSYTLAPGDYGRETASTSSGSIARKASASTSPPPSSSSCAPPACRRASSPATRAPTCRPIDGYYVVRQSSAHAWAEFWQAGVGWVRADPTGAVAPDRIGRSTRLAPQPGLRRRHARRDEPGAVRAAARARWEAINNRWNQWVLNYSRGQQLDVLKQMGFVAPTWEDLALLLVGTLSGLALAGAIWAWLDRHRVDPWVRQLERMKRALRPLGVAAAPHDPPRTARRARARAARRRRRAARGAARRARGAALRPRRGAPARPAHDARFRRSRRAGCALRAT